MGRIWPKLAAIMVLRLWLRSRGRWSTGCGVGGGPGDYVIAEGADGLDLGLDAVAGLQVELERVGLDRRHPGDGPGGEDVAGRVALHRVVGDQVRDRDEHLGGIAALADLAVDPVAPWPAPGRPVPRPWPRSTGRSGRTCRSPWRRRTRQTAARAAGYRGR